MLHPSFTLLFSLRSQLSKHTQAFPNASCAFPSTLQLMKTAFPVRAEGHWGSNSTLGHPFRPGMTSRWLVTAAEDYCQGSRCRKGWTWISSQRGKPRNNHEPPYWVTSELLFPGPNLEGRSVEALVHLHRDSLMPKSSKDGVSTVCKTLTIITTQKRCVRTIFQAYSCWDSGEWFGCCARVSLNCLERAL